MKSVALLALVGVVASVGQDASVDDWTFVESGPQGMIAMTEFAGGQAIIAQCFNGELKVLMTGMPATTQLSRQVESSRGDGRHSQQAWLPTESPGVFKAGSPGRYARFLRGGGAYEFHSADGETPAVRASFELPAQSANLDRVITACRWAVEDERDQIEQTAPGSFEYARTQGRRPGRSRPVGSDGRLVSVTHISCIVRNLRFQECRADHQLPAGGGHGDRAARDMNGERLVAADPAAIEGRVVYMTTTTEQIMRRD